MILTIQKANNSQPLSKNFRTGEFACKCRRCTATLVDEALVTHLQKIRDHFGKPLVITSGYRCSDHNAEVGGAKNSLHVKGQAADFYIKDVAPLDIAKYAESIGVQGIGLYDDFVHIDTRTKKSFWYGQEQAYRSTFRETDRFTVELRSLCRGCTGNDVKSLQALLTGFGFRVDRDGNFGPTTENAVNRYQKAHGLNADGIAGPQTQGQMLGV